MYDMKNKEVESSDGTAVTRITSPTFLDAVRTGRLPNADIEKAHQSTLLCHLGNIAYRTNSVLNTDPSNGHIKDNKAAEEMWGRQYAPGWEPQV